ncbi:LAO/AO transport system kinase [Natronoarchaeum philippinense]|uniref:LAO/AO transport system kinase n=1 Tax=Natronoarchaeum philippinense TaxID=558529 RepID=A0A285N2E4_NATPI|nr:methylmalonyl Co-A mutase-associated GTPase MeaB [Natronoarchaeum philippinense]SNZ02967.1 LAO/AO transport system kinase [Natronoarchaeum philippinense]
MSGDPSGERALEERDEESAAAPPDDAPPELIEDLLDGDHRALARVITKIENRAPGYRDLVSALHEHTGDADVVGITGSPGSGKSTLVDKLAEEYRERGLTVGVIAVDPSSPYTGGAVLGDRIRMASNVGDMEVFVRSMSARGNLGGLSTATADAVKALDAFGKDRIIIETVGAGQNEIDVVRAADTVAVLVPPASGDTVQMLKAGILEIADVFVVNKADLDGADRTVKELREMIELRDDVNPVLGADKHGASAASDAGPSGDEDANQGGTGTLDTVEGDADAWAPEIVETIATRGDGVDALIDAFGNHRKHVESTGRAEEMERSRYAEEIRTLLRDDASGLLEREIERRGGIDGFVDAVVARETDPYAVADDLLDPLRECVEERAADERD